MFKPIGASNEGGYCAFETLTEEQAKEGLLQAWSTPEQRAYNASTYRCPDCRGWGYRIVRRGRNVLRDSVGCDTCGGLGKLPKTYPVSQEQIGEPSLAAGRI